MNIERISELKEGDKVFHKSDKLKSLFTVTANYGDRATAVATVDITNPSEWEVAALAAYRLPEKP